LISAADWSGKNAMYRFFVGDAIHFERRLRVTIEHGHNNDLANDYAATAYWYQAEPHAAFPPLPSAEARLPRLDPAYRAAVDEFTAASAAWERRLRSAPRDVRQREVQPRRLRINAALDAGNAALARQLIEEVRQALEPFAE
jgi:hypothetical protein